MTSAREELNRLLESYTGIEVSRGGIDATVDAFLARRLAQARVPSLEEYLPRLAPNSAELRLLLDAITVTHTWFMRDPGQLAVVSELFAQRSPTAPPFSIWVPGCASGEDVYSLSILAERAGRTAQILGTDINSRALEQAQAGSYGAWSVRELTDVDSYFEREAGGTFRIAQRLKASVRFERHNLVEPAPRSGWDLVLCRNVLIYIARERARAVVEALADSLTTGGHLLLGASEVLFELPPQLEACYIAGRLALRRRAAPASVAPPPPARQPPKLPRVAAPVVTREPLTSDRPYASATVDTYRQAVEAEPTLAEPHLHLGIALYLEGSLQAALHELRAAAFLDASLWPAMFYSAVCHEALGQSEEAKREYRNVVRVAARAARGAERGGDWHDELIQLAKKRSGSAA